MNANDTLQGLWVPVVTPFDEGDRVDRRALQRLCRNLLARGARGIVALGTTGEPATLSHDEQRAVIEACAETCAESGGGLMVGAGTNDTKRTVAACQALAELPGVSAALVVVPYYTRPSSAGIVEHYRVVAAESPVPIVVYNVPYRTGRGLGAEDLLAIAALENVVGLKQSVGSLDADTLEVLRHGPSTFRVLSGDDAYIVPTMLMGGAGAIAAAAHVCTSHFAAMVGAAASGDVSRARQLAEALLPVVTLGFAEPNPALWKGALHQLGELSSPALRAPMTTASLSAIERLLSAVSSVETGVLQAPALQPSTGGVATTMP
jgi:4-hydroxy-tetrahydrodipicolinate synthase